MSYLPINLCFRLPKEQNQGGSFTDRTTASSQQYRDDRSQADDFASWKCYCFSAASPPGTTRDTREGRSNEAVTVLFIPASFKSLMEMGHCKEDGMFKLSVLIGQERSVSST